MTLKTTPNKRRRQFLKVDSEVVKEIASVKTDQRVIREITFKKKPLKLLFFLAIGFFLAFIITKEGTFFIKQIFKVEKTTKNIKPKYSYSYSGTFGYKYDPMFLIHELKKNKMELVLIDIRSKEEYKKGHIKKAFNLPVVEEKKNQDGFGIDENKLLYDLNKLASKSTTVIIYGQTSYSELPYFITEKLLRKGYILKILSVGWNEWYHFSNFWIPEKDWNKVNINDFVEVSE